MTLVTGGSGFIGRSVVMRLLKDELPIRVLTRGEESLWSWGCNVERAIGDVRDYSEVDAATEGVETVIHLAGKAHDLEELDPAAHEQVTVKGTCNLLAAAEKRGVRKFIFVSSLAVFGIGGVSIRDETSECQPVSAYGMAKRDAEQMVFEAGRRSRMQVCCLRPAMVYGAGCKGNLPRMIRAIDRGVFPPLPAQSNRRSMVHVSDVAEAVILAATQPLANGQGYIVTDGQPYSTRELYEMICRGLGKPISRWHVPLGVLKELARVGDAIGRLRGRRFVFDSDAFEKLTGNAWYSSEKIARELGFRPKVTFEDALPEMIDWYRKTRA